VRALTAIFPAPQLPLGNSPIATHLRVTFDFSQTWRASMAYILLTTEAEKQT